MNNTIELLAENRSRGWYSAETAPAWAKERILEIRSAVVAKRPIPAPSRQFIEGCEKRAALAASTTRHIRTLPPTKQSLEQQFIAANGYDPMLPKYRAARQAVEIQRDALVAQIAEKRRAADNALWNDFSPEGTESLRREVVKRGITLAEDGPGFDCPASSVSASKDDHERAAEEHRCLARRCQSSEDYVKHLDAAEAHDAAAKDLRKASTAVAACRLASNRKQEMN